MACHICDAIKSRKWVIYEDEKVSAFLVDRPASVGHVAVASKEHYPIMEYVPDYIVGHALVIANRVSVAVFDSLGAQGTNIIITNGVAAGQRAAHFMINLIARFQNDSLEFQWQPKQLNEEEMSTIELQIKEQAKSIGVFEREREKPVEIKGGQEIISEESSKDNYLIKQLRRMP